jgi:AraC family transcriptional regulator of arabinose operon
MDQIVTNVLVPYAGHHRRGDDYHIVRPRGSQDWLMMYTKRGEGFCRGTTSSASLVMGDLVLIDPTCPQDYGSHPPEIWDFLWVHFQSRPDWTPIIKSMPEIFPGHRLLKIPLKVRPLFVRLFNEIVRNATEYNSHADLCAMHQIERLLLAIHQLIPAAEQPLDSRILGVTRYIENHLNLPLQLEDLAMRAGMSKYRLAHLFSAQMGDTPHRFIMSQRIKRACDLLKTTTLSIGEIVQPRYLSRFRSSVALEIWPIIRLVRPIPPYHQY